MKLTSIINVSVVFTVCQGPYIYNLGVHNPMKQVIVISFSQIKKLRQRA